MMEYFVHYFNNQIDFITEETKYRALKKAVKRANGLQTKVKSCSTYKLK